MKTPKHVQVAIKSYLYHHKIAKQNAAIIKGYLDKNKIDKQLPLQSLLEKKCNIKQEKIIPGQITIFDVLKKEEANHETVEKSIDYIFKQTPEEKMYHQKWDRYIQKFHNTELENMINNDQVKVKLDIVEMFNENPKSFKNCYIDDSNNFDCRFGTARPTLRFLFEKKFKYIIIDSKCDLWKQCLKLRVHAVHSPFGNDFITGHFRKIALMVKGDELFYLQGRGYSARGITDFIGFLGTIEQSKENSYNGL